MKFRTLLPWFKHTTLAGLLALLLLPHLQDWLDIPVLRSDLAGYEAKTPRPKLSWTSLRASTYQDSLEQHLTENITLRERFIRPRNQIAYSLFGQTRARQIVFGQQGVLYEDRPIDFYLGRNAVSEDDATQRVLLLKTLQDSLARRGKLLVFVLAPSKPSYFPEYLPGEVLRQFRRPTNYDRFAPRLREAGVNFLDLSRLFQQWKDTVSYPLFPRGGTHWSGYGVTLAADTLLRYLERRGGFDLPNYTATGRDVTTRPRYTDNDLVRTMNLLWNPREFRMAYPRLQFAPPQPGQHKPNLLIVGDSFVWGLIEFYPYLPNLFGTGTHFWYYNREAQWRGTPPHYEVPANEYDVSQLDRRTQLDRHDVIVLLLTESNLDVFDFNFSAQCLEALARP